MPASAALLSSLLSVPSLLFVQALLSKINQHLSQDDDSIRPSWKTRFATSTSSSLNQAWSIRGTFAASSRCTASRVSCQNCDPLSRATIAIHGSALPDRHLQGKQADHLNIWRPHDGLSSAPRRHMRRSKKSSKMRSETLLGAFYQNVPRGTRYEKQKVCHTPLSHISLVGAHHLDEALEHATGARQSRAVSRATYALSYTERKITFQVGNARSFSIVSNVSRKDIDVPTYFYDVRYQDFRRHPQFGTVSGQWTSLRSIETHNEVDILQAKWPYTMSFPKRRSNSLAWCTFPGIQRLCQSKRAKALASRLLGT